MKNHRNRLKPVLALIAALAVLLLAGCGTVGSAAADLGLAGAGGVIGYQVSDQKAVGAAAGAALGYVASRAAQSEIQREISDAEKRGFERAMNQAVKQQYWVIQNQQRSRAPVEGRNPRLEPLVIPETKINGVIQNAHVEYLRIEP